MCEALIKSIEVNQKKGGFTVLDVPSNKLVNALASFFKEKNIIKPPKYTPIVKCCHANDCEPVDPDYLYYKAAAICRRLYVTKSKTLGVGTLRVMFGMKKRRGSQPPKAFRSGGKIVRDLVKQLKEAKYVSNYEVKDDENKGGLHLTKEGQAELDKIAAGLMKAQ